MGVNDVIFSNAPGPMQMAMRSYHTSVQDREDAERREVVEGRQDLLFNQGQQRYQAGLSNAAANRAALAKAQASADKFRVDFKTAYEGGTAASAGALLANHPEKAATITEAFDQRDANAVKAAKLFVMQTTAVFNAGQPQIAVRMMEERAVAARNSGNDYEADILEIVASTAKADPKAALALLNMTGMALDPDNFEEMMKGVEAQAANATVAELFTAMDTEEGMDPTKLASVMTNESLPADIKSELFKRHSEASAEPSKEMTELADGRKYWTASLVAGKPQLVSPDLVIADEEYQPQSTVGKRVADLEAGAITQDQFDASGGTSASEQQIGRIMETGVPRDIAIKIADGVYKMDRDQTTGAIQVMDLANGNIVYGGNAQTPPGSERLTFGEAFTDTGNSFGAEGFGRNLVNTAAGAIGAPLPFPETMQTQNNFAVLKEGLINHIS